MKWFLGLLVLLAAGLAAAALTVPTNAAVVNGTAISQQTLNSDVSAIAGSAYYQCYLNAQAALASNGQQALPPVIGAGKGQSGQNATATTAFVATYLDTEVGHQLVQQLADDRHVEVTTAQLTDARTSYENQITQVMQQVASQTQNPRFTCGSSVPLSGQVVLNTLPASFVDEQVQFFATAGVLQEDLSGIGASTSDLRGYFDRHQSEFDTACWTAAVYTSQSAATAALAQAQTTPFADVAKQAAQGGAQRCEPLPAIAAVLPSTFKLDQLAVGTVSFPIALGNGEYVLVQVTSRTPSSFDAVKPFVQDAVLGQGSTPTQKALQAKERHSTVTVDPRYGEWVPVATQILVPFTPATSDVLNPGANTAGLVPASASPTGG